MNLGATGLSLVLLSRRSLFTIEKYRSILEEVPDWLTYTLQTLRVATVLSACMYIYKLFVSSGLVGVLTLMLPLFMEITISAA